MACHVCSRPPSERLQFNCPTCARNDLYPLRLDHVKTLLEKDASGNEIDNAVAKEAEARSPGDATRWSIQAANTRSAQSAARTQLIKDRTANLRKEIAEKKKEAAQRRTILAQRRSDAESVNYRVSDRRAASVSEVQSDVQRVEQKWNGLHNKFIESRVFLCREAANLYGLRQKTRRRKGEVISTYTIGGISIIDLKDLNSKSTNRLCHPLANWLLQMPTRPMLLPPSAKSLTFSSSLHITFPFDCLRRSPFLTADIPCQQYSHQQLRIIRQTTNSPHSHHSPRPQAQLPRELGM